MDIRIRRATVEDLAGIAKVRRRAWVYSYTKWVPPDVIRVRLRLTETLRQKIENARKDKAIRALVAEIEGEIVGWCLAKKRDPENEIEELYVNPECKETVVQQLLLDKTLKWLKSGSIIVWVSAGNKDAISFYQSNLFVPTSSKAFLNFLGYRIPVLQMRRPSV